MTTEKMRVNASSVIKSAAETDATPRSCRRIETGSPTVILRVYHSSMARTRADALRWGLVIAAFGWLTALCASTVVASLPHPGSVPYLLSLSVHLLGSYVCHQRPERSFHWWGAQLPVCARCVGLYFGASIGFLAAALFHPHPACVRPSSGSDDVTTRTRVRLAVSVVPIALTLGYEWSTGQAPSNWVRAVSGLPFGAAIALVVADAATSISVKST